MAGRIIDGRECARHVKSQLADRVAALAAAGISVGLGTVLVGADPGSLKYVAGKQRDAHEVGMQALDVRLPATASQADVLAAVDRLNADPACTGYIVQLPLPQGIDEQAVLERIDPAKDADGLHPVNLGRLVMDAPGARFPQPCTAKGVVHLLNWAGIGLDGANICLIGRGITAGRPLGLMLSAHAQNATVTICHTHTRDVAEKIRRADIVVSAAGKAHFITADMIAPGATLVDIGVSRGPVNPQTGKSRIAGDFDPGCYEVAGAYTPNPGGVGPMTRAMLLANVVEIAEEHAHIN